MKRTKNMFYLVTVESDELFLYSVNDSFCYERIISPVLENLKRKAKKGTYDPEKAVDAFYYVACQCAKQYDREFSGIWQTTFSVTDRFTAAVEMERRYRDQILGLE